MKRHLIILTFFLLGIISCKSQHYNLKDTLTRPGDRYITYSIIFDLAKETIRPESYKFLDSVVTFLNDNKKITIEISNHCDERYSKLSSTCLTCRRAKSIAGYLISKGINSNRLIQKGLMTQTH